VELPPNALKHGILSHMGGQTTCSVCGKPTSLKTLRPLTLGEFLEYLTVDNLKVDEVDWEEFAKTL
jgi:hypothetical protein